MTHHTATFSAQQKYVCVVLVFIVVWSDTGFENIFASTFYIQGSKYVLETCDSLY